MTTLATPEFKQRTVYPALDAGPYPAYLASMVVTGKQKQRPYKGQEKEDAVDLVFGFEIIGHSIAIERDDGTEETLPKIISEVVKFIGGDKAKLTKIREGIDPTGLISKEGKELHNLLGEVCQPTLTKTQSKQDPEVFSNYVDSVSGKPNIPGWEAPAMRLEPLLFNFYEPDWDTFLKLPRWVQNKCKEATDFDGSELAKLVAANEQVQENQGEQATQLAGGHAV